MGFEFNPYDPCVANKMINTSQMIVRWHVDDLKISHKESIEVTKLICELGNIYGDGLSVRRRKIHSYIGMDFNYSINGTVKVATIPYSNIIKDDFPEPITSTASPPALDHIFQVRPDDEQKSLPEE